MVLKAFKDFKRVSLVIQPSYISLICKYLMLQWKSWLIPSSHATTKYSMVIKLQPLQPNDHDVLV